MCLALRTPLGSDFIMLRSFIETGKDCSRLLGHNSYFVILSCKLTDRIQRIKQHNCDEFNFLSEFATKQLNTIETTNFPVLNTDALDVNYKLPLTTIINAHFI